MSSSAIAQMLEHGARPAGPSAVRLADALLCVARQRVHFRLTDDQVKDLLFLLMPGRRRALLWSSTIVHFNDILDHLEGPDPTYREAARDVAIRLASDEVSLNPVAAPANYEGKHRNES